MKCLLTKIYGPVTWDSERGKEIFISRSRLLLVKIVKLSLQNLSGHGKLAVLRLPNERMKEKYNGLWSQHAADGHSHAGYEPLFMWRCMWFKTKINFLDLKSRDRLRGQTVSQFLTNWFIPQDPQSAGWCQAEVRSQFPTWASERDPGTGQPPRVCVSSKQSRRSKPGTPPIGHAGIPRYQMLTLQINCYASNKCTWKR